MNHRLARSASNTIAAAFLFTTLSLTTAFADPVTLKKGTDVQLAFDSSLSSRTAKPGDVVAFHVVEPVQVDGQTVIAEGTKVTGTVEKINKRARYGVNARIQLNMASVLGVNGTMIPLRAKSKGQIVGGRTGEAAAATAGGAILLGPLGLAAGLFVVGKSVNATPGDKTTVEVADDTTVSLK